VNYLFLAISWDLLMKFLFKNAQKHNMHLLYNVKNVCVMKNIQRGLEQVVVFRKIYWKKVEICISLLKRSEYSGNRPIIPEIELYVVNKVKIFHFPKKTGEHCWKIYSPGRSSVSAASIDQSDNLLAMTSGRVELYTSGVAISRRHSLPTQSKRR
jgi:hypothetical protein